MSSIEAPSTSHLWGIDGDRDVTGSDRVRMRDRKLHHRKLHHRKSWTGNEREIISRGFPGTPLESR
jgi:hypothetical protein